VASSKDLDKNINKCQSLNIASDIFNKIFRNILYCTVYCW